MGSIGWYIFRTTIGAFLVVLITLTTLIWITQALREIDLLTNQGQTVLAFVGLTGLGVPMLVLIIAPVALMIAAAHVLNKLSGDSELIVMNSAGMSPWRLFRAFILAAVAVSIVMAAISAYFGPKGLRALRAWITEIRTDIVTNIVQPGRFSTFEQGLTFHLRERRPNGLLLGIFLDDRRDPKERTTVLAEQGTILKNDKGTFLILEHGNVQRQEAGEREPNFVQFDRYAFDLSRFTGSAQILNMTAREKYITELAAPDPDDPLLKSQPGQLRAEFHDRILAPVYPIAFIIITYAFLGAPRTNRQSRGFSMASAIAGVAVLRLIGFGSSVIGARTPAALLVQYVALASCMGFGLYAIGRGAIIEPPALLMNAVNAFAQKFLPRPEPA
jgi:lipopolysaccharide export system permease protein